MYGTSLQASSCHAKRSGSTSCCYTRHPSTWSASIYLPLLSCRLWMESNWHKHIRKKGPCKKTCRQSTSRTDYYSDTNKDTIRLLKEGAGCWGSISNCTMPEENEKEYSISSSTTPSTINTRIGESTYSPYSTYLKTVKNELIAMYDPISFYISSEECVIRPWFQSTMAHLTHTYWLFYSV